MKITKYILIAAIMSLGIEAYAGATDDLRQRLSEAVANGKTYFGHHDDTAYGHYWTAEQGRSDVLETTGKYPGMMSWDLGDLEWGKEKNLDGVNFDKIRQEVIAQHKRGGLNTFSWHVDHPLTGVDSWKTADTTLVSQIVNTEAGRTAYALQLDYLCDFFNSLVDENGNKVAVIFRPWHEHTGSWFWWGRDNCSVKDYKALWTLMRDHFDARGVDNILWAYSPDRCHDAETYLERYPGDEYVDILGADVYHFNNESGSEEYMKCAGTTLSIAVAEAAKRGKIAAFTETGLEGLQVADWFMTNLLPVLQAYPVAYVVVWRNAFHSPRHFFAPYTCL
ncbi:MAG: glycoside hydrolase family 26 protein [Muribaculum sp.]|nr:glycoside hydrolase family 26 protein [Muribaculum sp.]